ncbi:MAG: ABC transporter ATP-binding protein [Patescibacteria group bacterium]
MKPILQAHNVSKIFFPGTPAEVRAVDSIDFELQRGEIVMIMGPSGGGKTTLLTMFGGLLTPTHGTISLEHKELTKLRQSKITRLRRERLGFIFQSFNLLENLTALENVTVAGFSVENRTERATELLSKLGLSKRLHAKPKNLSGGERQRVAIARALINDPALILADEPTANLDSHIGHEVMKILCSIGCEQGKSIIIVSHDERIKDVAHRVVYIEDGHFTRTEKGKHDQTCTMKDHTFTSKGNVQLNHKH